MSAEVAIKVYSILHALSSPDSLPPDTAEDILCPEMNNSLSISIHDIIKIHFSFSATYADTGVNLLYVSSYLFNNRLMVLNGRCVLMYSI